MEPEEKNKRMLAILIIQSQMLNCFALMMMAMVICYLVRSRRLKKRKRSRDSYKRSLKVAFRTDETTGNESSSIDSQLRSDASSSRGGKRGEKRVKYDDDDDRDDDDDIYESLITSMSSLGEVYAIAGEAIQELTSCFTHHKETADRRNQVASALQEIEGLSTKDVVKAAILITKNDNLCDCFFSIGTPEMKKQFVHIVLDNNGV